MQELRVCHEQVIAHELHSVADLVGQFFPAGPVIFIAAVLDTDDRVFAGEFIVKGYDLIGAHFGAVAFLEDVALLFAVVKLTAGHVEREVDLFTGLVPSGLGGGEDTFDGIFSAVQLRSETALIADGGGEAAFLEYALERVENLGDCA